MVRWVFVLILAALIAFRSYENTKNQLKLSDGQKIKIAFFVRNQPQIKYGQEYLTYQQVSFVIPVGSEVNYGDYIEVSGTTMMQVTSKNKPQISLKIDSFKVTAGSNSLGKQINTLRQLSIKNLKKVLPPEEAGLAIGMLLGGTQDMTSSQILAYRRSGLSHVVAASGYNVTLVAVWVTWLVGKWFGRRSAFPIIVLTIVGYTVLAGATAAVVRAAVMAIIAAVGLFLGRESDIRWVLLISVLLMLVVNPNYLSDIGFQLSVAATAGLVLFSPRNVWWTTVAAQVSTLPIILHYFGNLSLIAPISNVLVLWTVPAIMQLSAVGVVSGGWLAFLAWPLLKWCNILTYFFANLSFSSLTVQPLSWEWVIGYYLVLYLVYKLKFETKSQPTLA